MANTFRVDIVAPQGIIYSADSSFVLARTTGGDIGVLRGHTPLIGALKIHPVTIRTEHGDEIFAVSGGFLEVQPDKVTILATSAERPEAIDTDRAKDSLARAEKRLAERQEGLDIARAQASLERAKMRLLVKEKYVR